MRIQPQTINFATDEALAAEAPSRSETETPEPKTEAEDRSGDSAKDSDDRNPAIRELNAPVEYKRTDHGPTVGDNNGFGHGGQKLPPVW